MGVYSSVKCGVCNSSWRDFSWGKLPPHGPQYVKCSFCGNINDTELQWYSTSSKLDKITILVLMCWPYVIMAFMAIAFLFAIFSDIQKWRDDTMGGVLFLLLLLGFCIYRLISIKKSFRLEKDLIRRYDDNGGYLTSNEYMSSYS